MMIDRFSIPAHHVAFLDVAREAGLVDTADLVAMSLTHGDDWRAARDEVMGGAYARRHDRDWMAAHHATLCEASDAAAARDWMAATPNNL